MAERLEGDAAEQARRKMFRFQYEFFDMILDGQPWIIEAGIDFPETMDQRRVRTRIYSAAHFRNGNARVVALDEKRLQVLFIKRPERTRESTEEPV